MARRFLFLITAIAMVVSLGCSGDASDGGQAAVKIEPATTRPMATPRHESAPIETAKSGWSYDPSTRLDPFPVPDPPAITDATHEFELEQMALIGIIKGAGRDNALLLMPDGSDRIIHLGDRLGAGNGVVTEIARDHLKVEESYIRGTQSFVIVKKMNLADNGERRGG